MIVSVLPKGTTFARALQCIARAGTDGDPVALARNCHGQRCAEIVKTIQDAGGINSGDWGSVLALPEAQEFYGVGEQASIIGKLALRRVPLNVRTQLMPSGFSAHWVGGGKPKPLSKAAVSGDTLTPLKIAVLTAVTKELVRNSSPTSEARFRADMIRSLAEALDAAFIDPSNAGVTDVQPASVTNGVTPLPSTGNPGADVAALIAAFSGDYESAAFVTDPATAAEIALARDSAGSFQFPDAGPRGGSILGLPLVVSRSSPRDSSGGILALVDGSGIAYGAEGARTVLGEHATLEMLDNPTNDASDGTATTMVSMWQTNSVALLSEISANWKVVRPGSVVLVSDALYGTEIA